MHASTELMLLAKRKRIYKSNYNLSHD